MKGTVKFYNPVKNYGFISPDEGDEDFFVHKSNLKSKTLNEDDRVEFESESSEKGPQAVNVRKIE